MIALAFWILVAVFSVRLYFVAKLRSSTAFLGAAAVGLLGLFCTGVVIREQVLDGLIGGHNVLHLVRNLCVTIAVWLIRRGLFSAYSREDQPRAGFTHWPLALFLAVAAISAPFALQVFVPTTARFIPETVTQVPIYVYATTYMAILGLLCLSAARICLHHQESRPVRVSARVVGAGLCLLVVSCAVEIGYMTLRFTAVGAGDVEELLYSLFSPLFYGGVLGVVLGLGIPPVVKAYRHLQIRNRTGLVLLTVDAGRALWSMSTREWRRQIWANLMSADPGADLYSYVVRFHDYRFVYGVLPGSWLAAKVIASAQSGIDSAMGPFGSEFEMKRAS